MFSHYDPTGCVACERAAPGAAGGAVEDSLAGAEAAPSSGGGAGAGPPASTGISACLQGSYPSSLNLLMKLWRTKCSGFRKGFILDSYRKRRFQIFQKCRFVSDVTKFTLHSKENVNYIHHFKNRICIKFHVLSKNMIRIWKKDLVLSKNYSRTAQVQKH